MVTTHVFDPAARKRSYQLLAELWHSPAPG
jgi:hypothetical protein